MPLNRQSILLTALMLAGRSAAITRAAQPAHPADAPAGAIKIVGISTIAFLIYLSRSPRGAADGQAVRRL